MNLSLIIITKNAADVVGDCLLSVGDLVDEIVLVDDHSSDRTLDIAKQYDARIFTRHEHDLGRQKSFALSKSEGEWVLSLDADERLSPELVREIREVIKSTRYSGYVIPYVNHFLGRPMRYGGEGYSMLRLFKKDAAHIPDSLVHEGFQMKKGAPGKLSSPILHYSYRSFWQVLKKFTDYAFRDADQKYNKGESVSWQKLFLYGPHMTWARFVEDRGYQDGLFRLPLDLAFGYMEGLTYWILLVRKVSNFKLI